MLGNNFFRIGEIAYNFLRLIAELAEKFQIVSSRSKKIQFTGVQMALLISNNFHKFNDKSAIFTPSVQ